MASYVIYEMDIRAQWNLVSQSATFFWLPLVRATSGNFLEKVEGLQKYGKERYFVENTWRYSDCDITTNSIILYIFAGKYDERTQNHRKCLSIIASLMNRDCVSLQKSIVVAGALFNDQDKRIRFPQMAIILDLSCDNVFLRKQFLNLVFLSEVSGRLSFLRLASEQFEPVDLSVRLGCRRVRRDLRSFEDMARKRFNRSC
ncbi:hypothetical protein CEXT_762461 [Caerostris extrusa]|uniref:Uncharacterized protein n=1 Tax=Caerostris extrusa TaxID=172846 RepID=A0AAV4YCC6_CAEEX|nr:hypothetical protein CEXT_762461 [Caerostris extrusa]